MKKLILLFAIAASASVFAASPAATQQWVRNYVATNTTPGGVTEQWVRDYVATNTVAGGATQRWVVDYIRTGIVASAESKASIAENADSELTLAIYDAERSGLHALVFSHDDTSGNHSVRMADAPSGNGWTNVVYGCGVLTNDEYVASLIVNSTNYVCSAFSNYTYRNVFTYTDGAMTNDIVVWYSSVSTNEWKKARGEN